MACGKESDRTWESVGFFWCQFSEEISMRAGRGLPSLSKARPIGACSRRKTGGGEGGCKGRAPSADFFSRVPFTRFPRLGAFPSEVEPENGGANKCGWTWSQEKAASCPSQEFSENFRDAPPCGLSSGVVLLVGHP